MGEQAKDRKDRWAAGAHLTEKHESDGRVKSGADGGLIPGTRARVGDGTVDPSTLPYVKGTRQHRTLTREEYDDWRPPPMRRRTTLTAPFVWYCQNPNCSKRRDLVDKNGETQPERFLRSRCAACYGYLKRTGRERSRELVLGAQERKFRAEARSPIPQNRAQLEREHEDADRRWREQGICRGGHHVNPGELDSEGRCKSCHKHYYKTGRERPFDNDAFIAGNAEPADKWDLTDWSLERDVDTSDRPRA